MGPSLRTCVADETGCLGWNAGVMCADGFCGDSGTYTQGCATVGATECTGGDLRTCIADSDGCRAWSAAAACTDGFCADATACGACAHECGPAALMCVGDDLRLCATDEHGCRYEIASECGGGCTGSKCDGCAAHTDPIIGTLPLPRSAARIQRVGTLLYIPNIRDGLVIVDVSRPDMPVEVATLAIEARDVRVVDVSTPASPTVVGTLATPGWSIRVEVEGSVAYVLDGDLQLIDISLASAPTLLATHTTPGAGDQLAITRGRAFVLDSTNGVRVVDVRDQTRPTLEGAIPGMRSHKAIAAVGDHLFLSTRVSSSPDRFVIRSCDVSGAAYPLLDSTAHPHEHTALAVDGGRLYASGGVSVEVFDVTDASDLRLTKDVSAAGGHVYAAVGDPTGDGRGKKSSFHWWPRRGVL